MADRLRREIDEIVEKSGELPPPPPPRTRRRPAPAQERRGIRLNARSLLVAGLVFLLVGAILWGTFGSAGSTVAILGVSLIVAGYFLFFRNGSGAQNAPGGYEKRWRGQTIADEPAGPSLGDRIRTWRNRRKNS